MKKIILFATVCATALAWSCGRKAPETDGSGIFEAVETIVSSEMAGTLRSFDVKEGQFLQAGSRVGLVDTTQLYLYKVQLEASCKALRMSKPDLEAQIVSTMAEIERAKREQSRMEKLLKGGAVTPQQMDDANTAVKVAEGRLQAQTNSLQTGVWSVDEQIRGYRAQIERIDDQIVKSFIVNPVEGTVLAKYTEQYEVTSPGKPLYKIADIREMTLRAYITGEQLAKVKLGQQATVYANLGSESQRQYVGTVTWIAGKAEFTPKTIQTADERANLVYPVKLTVPNDDYIKIGMYGDVKF